MRPNRRSIGQAISLRALLGDERGAVGAYVVIISFVMISVGALAVDLGRLYTLDTELQAIADAAAMACARELDGEADSIDRGTLAAQQGALVANEQTFGAGESMPAIVNVRFFDELPPDTMQLTDPATNDPPYKTTDGTLAHYCETTVDTTTLNNTLIRIIPGAPDSADLFAMAVAGVESFVCNVPGLMICNPAEGGPAGPGAPFTFVPGQQILAKTGGSGAQWGPGTFGLIEDPLAGGGTSALREMLGQVVPDNPKCFKSTLNVKPGQAADIAVGLNMRLDVYRPPMNKPKYQGNANYRPAKHVVKGWKRTPGNDCNYQDAEPGPPPEATPYGRDLDLSDANRFGNGMWDLAGYWAGNHPNDVMPAGWDPANPPPRYDVYRYEVETPMIPDNTGQYNTPLGTLEDANAGDGSSCYNGPAACQDPADCPGAADFMDRRLLVVAVINCVAEGVSGSADNVPVVDWLLTFLTEGVGDAKPGIGQDKDIMLEAVRLLEPGVDAVFHEEIVLYR